MSHIDLLPSEVVLLEQALRHKEKRIKLAQRILEKAEEDLDEALDSIFERAGVEETLGKPRLLRGIDGRPAKIVWRDSRPTSQNGAERPEESMSAHESGEGQH